MKTFALMIGDRVQELIEAEDEKELAEKYHRDTVAKMVDVTDLQVTQNMVRANGVFAEPEKPAPAPSPITAERLLAVLIAKGVLSADDLNRKG